MSNKPFISIVTPTYNRRKFIPALIEMYKMQTYPKDRMEWIIYDDGTDPVRDIFQEAAKTIPNLFYFSSTKKLNIGAKRNFLNDKARGSIIFSMDDDDYYFPERIAYTVTQMASHPKYELAGCSEAYIYFTDNSSIWKLGPYARSHATNGTLAVRASYVKTHRYDEDVVNGEEKSFLDSYTNPIIQLNPLKVMLVIAHSENTFNKNKFRTGDDKFVQKTSMKLRDVVKDKTYREFLLKI